MEIDYSEIRRIYNTRSSLLCNNAVLAPSDSAEATHSNMYRDYITRVSLLRFLKPKKHENLIDFGCGIGRLAGVIAPKVNSIIGIDLSEGMIDKAKLTNVHDNVKFILNNGDLSIFPDSSISKIYTCWVLCHLTDESLDNTLKDFYRILDNNGKVVILEQISEQKIIHGNIQIHRMKSNYIDLFYKNNFILEQSAAVFRFPSYALGLWNKYKINYRWLKVMYFIERLTVNRKPQTREYHSEVFVFKKKV